MAVYVMCVEGDGELTKVNVDWETFMKKAREDYEDLTGETGLNDEELMEALSEHGFQFWDDVEEVDIESFNLYD